MCSSRPPTRSAAAAHPASPTSSTTPSATTNAGGHVKIIAQAPGALTVANSGPVIPGDQIQRLFRPFQKLAPDRDGYGLGLAIVNAVTQAHNATLTTGARPEGGLSVTVRFGAAHRQ